MREKRVSSEPMMTGVSQDWAIGPDHLGNKFIGNQVRGIHFGLKRELRLLGSVALP